MKKRADRGTHAKRAWIGACLAALACLALAVVLAAPGAGSPDGVADGAKADARSRSDGPLPVLVAHQVDAQLAQASGVAFDGAPGETGYSASAESDEASVGSPLGQGEASDLGEPAEASETVVVDTPAGSVSIPKDAIVDYGGAEYEPEVVLVQPREGATGDDIVAALAEAGAVGASVVREDGGYVELGLPAGLDVELATGLLRTLDEVDAAQPDFIYHLAADGSASTAEFRQQVTTIDGGLEAQATRPSDRYLDRQWALESMKAYDAWDIGKTDRTVTVAVLDDGFQTNHADLRDNIAVMYNAVTDKESTSVTSGIVPPEDDHGTHVAGIVAATANNGRGIAGVSYNAKLMLVKVFTGENARLSDIVQGIDYVIANKSAYNVRVLNLSVGVAVDSMDDFKDDILIKAIDRARAAGIVVVCSAGNETLKNAVPYINYPSDYSGVVGVINLEMASTKPLEVRRNSGSNYNLPGATSKNISAPGTDIFSTTTGGGYSNMTGTSMAAPQVSGVLAMVFAKSPSLSAAEAISIIYSNARDIGAAGFDEATGYGEVDALE